LVHSPLEAVHADAYADLDAWLKDRSLSWGDLPEILACAASTSKLSIMLGTHANGRAQCPAIVASANKRETAGWPAARSR
jgi:hypothetical protein